MSFTYSKHERQEKLQNKITELRRTISYLAIQIESAIEQIELGDKGMATLILKESLKDRRFVYK